MTRLLGMARPAGRAPDAGRRVGRSTIKRLPWRSGFFPKAGTRVLRAPGSESCLIFDCGPLGPDYQPGHGHCDVLSYELSLHGQRVVVDTGVSTYEPCAERLYERSTAAHNTLRVDGEEQAEVWASFRVGRRPQGRDDSKQAKLTSSTSCKECITPTSIAASFTRA